MAAAFIIALIPAAGLTAAPESFNKAYTGTMECRLATDPEIDSIPIAFTADIDTLLYKVNTQYQPEVAKLCSVLSTDVYSSIRVTLDDYGNNPTSPSDDTKLHKAFGFTDVTVKSLRSQDFSSDNNDLSRYLCSHRLIETTGRIWEIILVAIEGTNGTLQQWTSNMDVGADTEDYYRLTGQHPEWTNKKEHKGFNVTCNRISAGVKDYINKYVRDGAEKIILITGHSRGGALANLLGREYEDAADYKSFTYTFAAPNTTTDEDAGRYKTIFNVVNTQDIITAFPMEEWGFRTYGTTLSVNMGADNNWKDTTGKDNYDSFDFTSAVNNFNKVSKNREDFYKMDRSESDTGRPENPNALVLTGLRDTFASWVSQHAKGQAVISAVTGDGPFSFTVNLMPTFTTTVIAFLASAEDRPAQLGIIASLMISDLMNSAVSKYIAPIVNMIDGYMNNSVLCGHSVYAYYGAASRVKYHTHVYGEPEIRRSGDSFTLIYKCNDCDDIQTVIPKVTGQVTKEATLTETGNKELVLNCIFNGEEYTKKIEDGIPRLEARNFIERIIQGDVLTIVITIVCVILILGLLIFLKRLLFR